MTTLNFYWDLASFDPAVRKTAAFSLIKTLVDFQQEHESKLEEPNPVADTEEKLNAYCSADVSYAVRRLIRGLPSSREGARQGFSLALTELLAIVDVIATKVVLDLLFQYTERTGSMSGEEIRDMLFGRLFGLMSIVTAGMISRESTTTEDIIRMLESLKEMSTCKSYLAEVCHHVVINILPHLKDTQHETEAVTKIKELFFNGPIVNVDQLNLVIGLQHHLPKTDLSEELSNWKSQTILAPVNLPHLSNILKEIPADTQEALADWKPELHSVWDPLLSNYFNPNPPKGIATFQEFWDIAVDKNMFHQQASHGRKYWGFSLIEKAVRRLSPEEIPLIFTANFMRTFINNLSSDLRFLNKAAKHTAQVIQEVAEKNKQVGFSLITQLLGNNGHQNFDRITHTRTVESLLTTLDAEGIKSYIEYLAKTFVTVGATEEKAVQTTREWALNQMTLLITNPKIPKEEEWVSELVNFIMTYCFFDVKKTDKSSSVSSGLHRPSPALSEATVKFCREKFQLILASLSKLPPLEKVNSASIKTRKLNGFTNNGELWAFTVYKNYTSLTSNKKLTSLLKLSAKTQASVKDAMKLITEIKSKLTAMDKNETYDSLEHGFEILLLNVILHILINEEEGISILNELTDCYDKTFRSKKPSQKKKPVQTEEQPDPINVIVDILVSFLTNESPVLKNLAEQVFEIFSHKLTKESIEMLLNIVANTDDKKNDEELFGSDEEEEEEVEENGSDDSSSSEEEGEEEESDVEMDEELHLKVQEMMKAQGINSTEDSDEELVDDDAMAAFDEKLAEVFKQKKILKDEKNNMQTNVVHFKNNVMGLIIIYARKNPTNPLVLSLIVPLLKVIRSTPSKSSTNQFVEKVIAFLRNRLAKSSEYPKVHDDYVFDIMKTVHDYATHSTSSELSDMYLQLSLYLRKCILGGSDFELNNDTPKETIDNVNKLMKIYAESVKVFMTKRSTSFPSSIIQQMVQRYPLSSWPLLDTLVVYLDRSACVNVFRLSMACTWTCAIIQRSVGQKHQAYTQKFKDILPTLSQSIQSTLDISTKNAKLSLDSKSKKNYMRFVSVIIKIHKKIESDSTVVSIIY
ncbi:DNA polymerase phi-domain-containing protein [Pilobolus umbonatus]|nr:DNA polymerase phi-domain-containing protein [Pilobolus umbonatus]